MFKNDINKQRGAEVLTRKDTWDNLWGSYIEDYIFSDPKHGVIVETLAKKHGISLSSTLETGCGSARDSRYLANTCNALALDLSLEPLDVANSVGQKIPLKGTYTLIQGDIFHLPFRDKKIDISFNSDLLIYFADNKDISKILDEQRRVTKGLMVIFVHNKFDIIMSPLFQYLYRIKGEKLYDIRRFSPKEIKKICERSGVVLEIGACEYSVPIALNKLRKIILKNEFDLGKLYIFIDKLGCLRMLFLPTELYVVVDVR